MSVLLWVGIVMIWLGGFCLGVAVGLTSKPGS